MKKKLAILLTVLLSICMLSACGKDKTTVDYNGKSYDELSYEAVVNAYCVFMLAPYIGTQKITDADIEAMEQYGYTRVQLESCAKWAEAESKYGACTQFPTDKQFDPNTFDTTGIYDLDKAGNTLTSDLTLKFGEKDVVFEVVYDYYDMSITSISINPVQSMGEKMTSAGQNTLISLSIVFFVLILISLIIKGFVIFPMIEEKKKKKLANTADNTDVITSVPTVEDTSVSENLMDDTELIAVIAAAIAASEGTSTSDFVVRSINRR